MEWPAELAAVEWATWRPATTVLTEPRIAPAGHHVRHQDGGPPLTSAEVRRVLGP